MYAFRLYLYSVIQLTRLYVFINGAATVSIESEGISNPHEDAVLEPGGFLRCKLLGARGRRAGAAEEEKKNFFLTREESLLVV